VLKDAQNQPLALTAFSAINHITNRGYTGHEMVDGVDIIHMNGRIYDAKLARFLQADPFIQAPYNTQSLNRYSYVWNNPLNATDPSGYWFLPLLAAFIVTDIIVTIGINSGWDPGLITALVVISNCLKEIHNLTHPARLES
jgi:RHS repeat-associated protein